GFGGGYLAPGSFRSLGVNAAPRPPPGANQFLPTSFFVAHARSINMRLLAVEKAGSWPETRAFASFTKMGNYWSRFFSSSKAMAAINGSSRDLGDWSNTQLRLEGTLGWDVAVQCALSHSGIPSVLWQHSSFSSDHRAACRHVPDPNFVHLAASDWDLPAMRLGS
ncbi:hypothetical protein GQ607_005119, partial [Colletotrichum asianum]